jgi:hypothetical protein
MAACVNSFAAFSFSANRAAYASLQNASKDFNTGLEKHSNLSITILFCELLSGKLKKAALIKW